ncbi:MAG: hypothetical protein HYZ28_10970 [Myxococcales bacterium]|nr:hypothetical protein [Myxococcales bacterium]
MSEHATSSLELPVTVAHTRPDGSVEHVRIGTAVPTPSGLSLRLEPLHLEGAGLRINPPLPKEHEAPAPLGPAGDDLEYYASRARRRLADPTKARWHEHERALLAEIEAEMNRRVGRPPRAQGPPGGHP